MPKNWNETLKEQNGRPVTCIEIVEEPELDPRLKFVKRLFAITLLIFCGDEEKERIKISKPRLVFSILLTLLISYNIGNIFHFTFAKGTDGLSDNLMAACWSLQCLVSTYFTIYWQFGYFQIVLNPKTWTQFGCKSTKIRLWPTYTIFAVAFSFIFVSCIWLVYLYYIENPGNVPVWLKIYEAYGPNAGGFGIFLAICSASIWLTVFFFYSIVSVKILEEFDSFNGDLKEIGNGTEDQDKILEELMIYYDRQVNLTTLVRQINSTFEVYCFVMIGTNIPTIIFSIVNFAQNFKHATGMLFFRIFFNVFVSLIDLFALTRTPARLHTSVHAAEGILFANKKIWFPHNEKIHQIISILISHSQQSDLGLSLWGYTLMTKSLILTIASVTITYLTLIMQMDKDQASTQWRANLTVT